MIPCFATARTATRTRAAGMASSWCWRSALRCASSCSRVSWFVPPPPRPLRAFLSFVLRKGRTFWGVVVADKARFAQRARCWQCKEAKELCCGGGADRTNLQYAGR